MSTSQQQKNKKRQKRNRKYKELVKNQKKKISLYLAGKLKEKKISKEEIEKIVPETQEILDKAAQKGIIHKNRRNKLKSKIQIKFNRLKANQSI